MCFCVTGAPGRLNTGLAVLAESNLHFERQEDTCCIYFLMCLPLSYSMFKMTEANVTSLNMSNFHKISGVILTPQGINFLCYACICPLNHLVSIFLPSSSSPSPPPSLCCFLLSPWGEVEMGHTFPPSIPALMGTYTCTYNAA